MLLPLVMPILVSRGFAAAIAGRSIKLHKALQLNRSRKKRSMAERTIPVVPTNEHAGIPNIKAYDIGIDGLPRVSKPNSCTDTDVSRTLEVERHLPAVLVTTRRLRSFAIPCDAKDSPTQPRCPISRIWLMDDMRLKYVLQSSMFSASGSCRQFSCVAPRISGNCSGLGEVEHVHGKERLSILPCRLAGR